MSVAFQHLMRTKIGDLSLRINYEKKEKKGKQNN